MSKTAAIIKSFEDQFVAFVTGDDARVKAEKAKRQAITAIEGAINALNGKILDKAQSVEDAQEALTAARVNKGEVIKNREVYITELRNAKQALLDAEKALKTEETTREFFQQELDAICAK